MVRRQCRATLLCDIVTERDKCIGYTVIKQEVLGSECKKEKLGTAGAVHAERNAGRPWILLFCRLYVRKLPNHFKSAEVHDLCGRGGLVFVRIFWTKGV